MPVRSATPPVLAPEPAALRAPGIARAAGCLIALGLGSAPALAQTAAEAAPAPAPAPVTTVPPKQRSGTAFVVDASGRLLTNAHVVADCARIELTYGDGRRVGGRIAVRDPRSDLALLEGAVPATAVAAFARAGARAGDDVIALGYPLRGLLAMEANVSTGIVSATAGLKDDPTRLQISAPIQPGHSGGPLLDESGAVVGVVVSKLNALRVARMTGDVPQNVNFAIKSGVAQAFLRAHGIEPALAEPPAQRPRTADVVQAARAFTALVECATQAGELATGAPPATGAAPIAAVPAPVAPGPTVAASTAPAPSLDLPVRCVLGEECAPLDFFDHGEQRDFACGHRAAPRSVYTRFALLGEHLGRRDLAIVAAADGRVVGRGESGLTLEHGGGWRTVYRFDTGTAPVPVGTAVRRGDVLGRLTPFKWGTSTAAVMGFAVTKDGRALDPFRPEPSSAGCGASADTRWSPAAQAALGYVATAVLDAGFAAKDLDAAGLQAGDLPPVTRESTHLSFWVRRVGVRAGDRELIQVLDPAGRAVGRHELVAESARAAGLLQIARRNPAASWAPGTYRATYTLTRDGAELVSAVRELTLR
jgi:S1-C subfamily serine protease